MAKVLSLHAATLRRNGLFWDTAAREEIRQRARDLERDAVNVEREQAAARTDQASRQELSEP